VDDDTEEGVRVGKLSLYSETDGWPRLAAAEFEVNVDVERSEGCEGKEGQ
jgi:hypothetical protein